MMNDGDLTQHFDSVKSATLDLSFEHANHERFIDQRNAHNEW